MFAVIFEVLLRPGRWDSYLAHAGRLRPELLAIDGFVDNIRYRSLTRDGLLLSLSGWRDEKSLVRWRTHATHHEVQEKGRTEVFADYHLRIGEIVSDTRPPQVLRAQRLDETDVGAAKTVMLIDGLAEGSPEKRAARLGLRDDTPGLVAWDVFDAVLTPGDTMLLLSWRDDDAARTFAVPADARVRRIRVIRDYGIFDRREAPQYYPAI